MELVEKVMRSLLNWKVILALAIITLVLEIFYQFDFLIVQNILQWFYFVITLIFLVRSHKAGQSNTYQSEDSYYFAPNNVFNVPIFIFSIYLFSLRADSSHFYSGILFVLVGLCVLSTLFGFIDFCYKRGKVFNGNYTSDLKWIGIRLYSMLIVNLIVWNCLLAYDERNYGSTDLFGSDVKFYFTREYPVRISINDGEEKLDFIEIKVSNDPEGEYIPSNSFWPNSNARYIFLNQSTIKGRKLYYDLPIELSRCEATMVRAMNGDDIEVTLVHWPCAK